MDSATRTSPLRVPLIDLGFQNKALAGEILPVWRRLLEQSAFIGGPEVAGFESEFAAYAGAAHGVGVSSGTDALRLALQALDVGPGDEVLTVPLTFIATVEAITQLGARPLFVDVDEATATMDPAAVETALTPRVRALLPVHLYGQPADMRPLLAIAAGRGLPVLEDAAQAQGARYGDRRAGSLGSAAAFSFYPAKNLGACGEAGIVTTSNADVAHKVELLRDHGQQEKNHHEIEGTNARLDALQAAALRIKLRHLDDWNDQRRRLAGGYAERLAGLDVVLPVEATGRRHVYHQFVIRHPQRDRLRRALGDAGVATGLHYPVPLHRTPAYAGLGLAEGAFPVAEAWARQCLSLPLFPGMTTSQLDRVCDVLREAL